MLIHYVGSFILYSFSIALSFLFSGFFIRPLTLTELKNDEEEDEKALKRLDEENFEYKYLDELEQLEKIISYPLEEKETTLEIPFINANIIMFYEDNVFKYYCNKDVIYKYLNVACRKFVIEHNSRGLYLDGEIDAESEEVTTESMETSLFIKKVETKLFEKKINKFVRVGSIHDYNEKKNIKLVKEIDILDFLQSYKSTKVDKVDKVD